MTEDQRKSWLGRVKGIKKKEKPMNIDDLFPLQPFAKLFETSRGQVLCTAAENDDGRPALCFQVTLQTGQLLNLAIGGWADSDAGWKMADDALEGTTLEQAENFVTKVIPQLFETGLE